MRSEVLMKIDLCKNGEGLTPVPRRYQACVVSMPWCVRTDTKGRDPSARQAKNRSPKAVSYCCEHTADTRHRRGIRPSVCASKNQLPLNSRFIPSLAHPPRSLFLNTKVVGGSIQLVPRIRREGAANSGTENDSHRKSRTHAPEEEGGGGGRLTESTTTRQLSR